MFPRTSARISFSLARSLRVLAVVTGMLVACAPQAEPTRELPADTPRPASRPRLVLQITVDQLRGDLPTRFLDRLGEGGFRYLLEHGTHYANAHYRHANTETAVGHATLFTGTDPSRHGIIANDWIDSTTGAFVYNTEDDRHHLIGKDPQPHKGMSPRNLLASTIGDELVVHNAGRSRVFSVSIKDRGAILPGGHAGKAFWYSKSTGDFVTSTYYYDAYPAWVTAWNGKQLAASYRGKRWELLHDRSTYIAAEIDDRPFEADFPPMGRTFPHELGDDKYLYLRLSLSPVGDALTLDFAKTLIKAERLGQGAATDFLAVSFSSTDYVGHLFGPSSLESEDNLLRLDRQLAELFAYVDEQVGLANTLIVLSADHGAPEAPEHMAGIGMETGRYDFDYFRKPGPLTEALERRFGRGDLIETHSHPYLYLDAKALADADLEGIAAIHGSPWAYDTFVPIFFAGHRVPQGKVYRPVGPHDIAATLAAYLDIKPPSGSEGTPLVEVLAGLEH